nr:hypothetical protein [Tanacetum cinerariifolium]
EQYLTFTDHGLWEVMVNGDLVSPVASASAGAKARVKLVLLVKTEEIVLSSYYCLYTEVIENGNAPLIIQVVEGVETRIDPAIIAHATAEEKAQRRLKLKARSTLLMVETSEAKASADKLKVERKNLGPPLIEDWISDSEDEAESKSKIEKETVKPSFAKINFVKSKVQVKSLRKTIVKQVLLRSGIVNIARQNFSKTAVLVNTARQVSTAHPKSTVNAARPMSQLSKTAHSTVKRPFDKKTTFTNSNVTQKVNIVSSKTVNTARPKAVVNAVFGNRVNDVKASACWVWKPKTKVIDHGNPQMSLQNQGEIDNGCSRHMTGNISYRIDNEEID